jgi:hypothetical protein
MWALLLPWIAALAAPPDPAPLGNVRIRVTSTLSRTADSRSLGLGRPPSRRGVEVRGGATRSQSRGTTVQELLVMDGGKASLRVAEEVAYPDWFWTWGLGQGLWVQGTAWKDVGASLVVEPRMLGDGRLRLRLTPAFEYWTDRGRLVTEAHSLSTEVLLRDGEEVDLGGLPLRDEEFRERFFLGLDESRQVTRAEIRVRATLE